MDRKDLDRSRRSRRAERDGERADALPVRLAGVTGEKRRRHYGHAASLVAACGACDRSPGTAGWAAALGEAYRRIPAFRSELDLCLGRR